MAPATLTREDILALYRAALAWQDEGHSAQAILEKLAAQGLDVKQAGEILAKLTQYRSAFVTPPMTANDAAGIAMWALGLLVTFAGAGLFLGNVSGLAPSVPFAGYVVMGLGSVLLTAAANRTARL